MGKLIAPLLIGFFMGLSGGGFFSVWRTAQAHEAAVVAVKSGKPLPTAKTDSTGTDSTAGAEEAASAAADSGHGETSAPAAPAATPAAAHGDKTGHGPDTHDAAATPPTATTRPAAASADAGALPRALGQEARLAKLFGAMAPKDAARVLAQMDNRDVQTILNLVGDKQAAAILTELPPDRAVAFSQGQLRRSGGQ